MIIMIIIIIHHLHCTKSTYITLSSCYPFIYFHSFVHSLFHSEPFPFCILNPSLYPSFVFILLLRSPFYSLILSFLHSFTHSLFSLFPSFILFILSFSRSFILSFSYPSIPPFFHSFILSFFHPFILILLILSFCHSIIRLFFSLLPFSHPSIF